MALMTANSNIGPNSLQPFSDDQVQASEWETLGILSSAEIALADYQCPTPPEAFASLGPSIVEEVSDALTKRDAYYAVNSPQSVTNEVAAQAAAGATITDQAIADAPNATPLGSQESTPIYTDVQIAAATDQPINWAERMTLQPGTPNRPYTLMHRRQSIVRMRRQVQTAPATENQPTPQWSGLPGSRQGWCAPGLGSKPWGKLLLFAGLGLIAVGLTTEGK